MASAIDDLLASIRSLSDRIAQLDESPERARLEERREQVRAEARLLGDATRSDVNL